MFSSDVTARGLDYPDVTLVLQVRVHTDWLTDCYDVYVCVCACVCVCVSECECFVRCAVETDVERQGHYLTSKGKEGSSEFSFSDSRTPLFYLYLTLYPILTLPLNLYLSVCVRLRWVWQRRTSTCTDWAVRRGQARRAAGYCSAHHLKHQVWCLALHLPLIRLPASSWCFIPLSSHHLISSAFLQLLRLPSSTLISLPCALHCYHFN